MHKYKYHPITIRDTLKKSLRRLYLPIVRFVILWFLIMFILSGSLDLWNGLLIFVPPTIAIVLFLGLEWLDLHFTCFYLTDDVLSRQQYGRVTRRILRNKVTEIQQRYEGLMVMTTGPSLLVPNGLVGEDGISCDLFARLYKWLPEESTGAS